jgi:predicted transcriptional regulator
MDATNPGTALKAWRDAQSPKMTQGDLATMLGVSQSYVSLLEAGNAEPRASIGEHLRRLTDGAVTWEPLEPCVHQEETVRKEAV